MIFITGDYATLTLRGFATRCPSRRDTNPRRRMSSSSVAILAAYGRTPRIRRRS